MLPTGNSNVDFGSTARHALTTAGGNCFGREHLEAVRARRQCRQRLGGRRHAGQAKEPEALRLGDDARVAMRHDDESPALVGHAGDVPDVEHGARADQAALPKLSASARIDASGCGELSGTSSTDSPWATSAAPIAGTSAAEIPRSTAISGSDSR